MVRAVFLPASARVDPGASSSEFAQTFYFFILRFVLFFTTATVAVRAFRGALLERSLHFDLLAPLRREVLVVGKYAGAVATSLILLVPSLVFTLALYYLPVQSGRAVAYPFLGDGLPATLSYLGVSRCWRRLPTAPCFCSRASSYATRWCRRWSSWAGR